MLTRVQRVLWWITYRVVRLRCAGVPAVDSAGLARWLADGQRKAPCLLDVRGEAEYKVSHLPNAWWADPRTINLDSLLRDLGDRPVVVYCSAGYRSGLFARRLISAGKKNVFNMEGSIFAWVNEGHAVESAGGPTTRVHPFNRVGGWLLRPESVQSELRDTGG